MKKVEFFERAMAGQAENFKDRGMADLKKQREKNHWALPFAYAGRWSVVHIWLVEDKDSSYFGKYHVYCGAVSEIADTFEEAAEQARRFTHGGVL